MASACLTPTSSRRIVWPLFRSWELSGLVCHNVIARAGANDSGNPLGEASFWDQAEGKEKLNAIEEMRELVAEGERIQNERVGDAGEAVSEEEAQDRAAKLREELAKVSDLISFVVQAGPRQGECVTCILTPDLENVGN